MVSGGGGAWRRRLRRAPSLSAMTDEEMQRVVLGVVLREYPVLLTYPAIACELFENPDDVIGGMTLCGLSAISSWRGCCTATASSSCRAARRSTSSA